MASDAASARGRRPPFRLSALLALRPPLGIPLVIRAAMIVLLRIVPALAGSPSRYDDYNQGAYLPYVNAPGTDEAPIAVLAVTRIACTERARRCTPNEAPRRVSMMGIGFRRG